MKENEMIFGIRAIIEAIEADKEIDKIIIKNDMQSEVARQLFAVLKDKPHIPVQRVPMERINRYTRKNHQGAIAFISQTTYQRIDDIVPFLYESGKAPFFILLDGITDVRNFGAIARTCECVGVDAIIIPAKGGASVNADAIKTSAGALHTIPVCKENNLADTVRFLKNSGITVIAATEKAARDYTQADFSNPVAIVLGAEDTGVSPNILRQCDEIVKIPVKGKIASLNVSVAAGVLIYEAARQRSAGE
jgi:23S rRNA (guanosine2251-2'-O)-methyltransferase